MTNALPLAGNSGISRSNFIATHVAYCFLSALYVLSGSPPSMFFVTIQVDLDIVYFYFYSLPT